jgi:gluconolactonase
MILAMCSRTGVTSLVTVAIAGWLGASLLSGQTSPNVTVAQPAPDIPGIVRGGTLPEIVVRGLTSADDPVWLPNIGLVFSESQANRVVKLGADDQVSTFVGDLHGPLGMTFDRQGRLISLQTQAGFRGPRIVWPPGKEAVIADNFEGTPFGRPNDIVSDAKGGVYFTDLPMPPLPPGTMAPAVYYVPPGSVPIRVAENIGRPNGLQLSRDEKMLYVNDTAGINIYAFDVTPDGRLTNRRVFASYMGRDRSVAANDPPRSNADGLVIDEQGRLYGLTEAGVEVVSPSGQHLGVIPVWCITRRCQNLTFGGPDKSTIYVAGGGTLLRIQMLARGYRERAK